MQGAEYQHAHFGRRNGECDRFHLAHFAHENYVGVLTNCGAKRRPEPLGVEPDLAMRKHAFAILMHELDGVFNRNDVLRRRAVNFIDDSRQRGRLPRAGGAGDEHETTFEVGQVFDRLAELQLLDRNNFFWNDAEHSARAVLLHEIVRTITRDALKAVRKVDVLGFGVFLPVLRARNLLQQFAEASVGQDFPPFDLPDLSLCANTRHEARSEVKIGSVVVFQVDKHFVELRHVAPVLN